MLKNLCGSLIATTALLASTAAMADQPKSGTKSGKGEVHKVGPVHEIQDNWTPGAESDALFVALSPADIKGAKASAIVDKDGTWAFSGSLKDSPCYVFKLMDPTLKCQLQFVMALKSDKGTWFYFQEDSGEIKGKDGVTWQKQGKSKVLSDNFEDFAGKGHEWTVSMKVGWKFEPTGSSSGGGGILGDVSEVAKTAGTVLSVVSAALAFF